MPTELIAVTDTQSQPISGFARDIYSLGQPADEKSAVTYGLGQSLAVFDANSAIPERLGATVALLIGAAASPSGRDWIPTTYRVLRHPTGPVSTASEFEVSRPQFAASLKDLFEEEEVQDGQSHEGERWIRDGLSKFGAPFSRWLEELIRSDLGGQVSVGMLRCIGRLPAVVAPWGKNLAISLLASDAVEIRDACVRALEYWGGGDSAQALREHREKTPWLADYIRRVVRDLERRP